MAQSGMQMPMGEFAAAAAAMTPAGVTPAAPSPSTGTLLVSLQGGPGLTGMSPIAKRPRDVSTFAAMNDGVGGNPTMSNEDLTGGFHNLHRNGQRDAAFAEEIAKAVHENAVLLNAVISRVNVVEAGAALVQKKNDEIGTKLDDLAADALKGLAALEKSTVDREGGLRQQLSAMAERLEQGHAELQNKIDKAGLQQAPPGAASTGDVGVLGERLRLMSEKMDTQVGLIGKTVEQYGARIEQVEINAIKN